MLLFTLFLLLTPAFGETEVGRTCFNQCMGNPRNSFAKCRQDCSGQLTKPKPASGGLQKKVGNGGCSCRSGGKGELFCRTGSEHFKLSKDECFKKALELGAAGFEFGGTDNCWTHTATPIASNGYPGVTCYELVKPQVLKVGRGGCSCRSDDGKPEQFCRTGSQQFKLSKYECEKKALEIGALGFEFGGRDNCMTHAARPIGGNNYPGVFCYKFGTEEAVGGYGGYCEQGDLEAGCETVMKMMGPMKVPTCQCPETSAGIFMASASSGSSIVVQGLALVGFLATAYGAVRHYIK